MNEVSFFDIVAGSGGIGIMLWLWIFALSFAGGIVGIFAVAGAFKIKENKYPLALKFLFCISIATLMAGVQGTITGYVDSFAKLGTSTGSAKAQALELSMSMANMSIKFALISVFIQAVFGIIALSIIEKRAKEISIAGLSIRARLSSVPLNVYIALFFAGLGISGGCFSLGSIQQILLLKPGEVMPNVMGIDYALFLKICSLSSLIAILLFSFPLKIREKTG